MGQKVKAGHWALYLVTKQLQKQRRRDPQDLSLAWSFCPLQAAKLTVEVYSKSGSQFIVAVKHTVQDPLHVRQDRGNTELPAQSVV